MTRHSKLNDNYIARLNLLLRFAKVNLWTLTNEAREKLLDDLFFALYDFKRDREEPLPEFVSAAKPEALGKAQHALNEQLDCKDERHSIHLAEQEMILFPSPDRGEFLYRFRSKDFTTMMFMEFAHLLFMSELVPADFLHCSHCQTWYVPRRKAKAGAPTYCSKKCANVIAARLFRANKRKARTRSKQAGTKRLKKSRHTLRKG